ncbi:type VI secretion system protein ImpK [Herbaspirillum sp. 1173]|uniref:DotU family type IV/VI secretion system protein n=1 Tax=Herbaspirillum sp. 1173 TaxID=2817734 RepID=UPI0028568F43|nr:DotU family type IV/VI secretion system protein [Herbaspirillum sp. 1173]MDR6739156.1 type VI secretion system protein ImpK [Herbaspirillum sp. 1173]
MRLVDCFIPLLAQVRQFQRQPDGDPVALSAQLDAAVGQARRDAHDGGHADADTEEALFAVLALADELILATDWLGRGEWQRRLLQRRYFGVTNAGVAFYTRLENLSDHQVEVREVYFLCLGLGFAGRYGYDRNQKALTDIKRANAEILLQGDDGLPGEAGKLLFPDGYAAALQAHAVIEKPARSRRRRWFSSLAFNAMVIPLVVVLVLYGIYHVIIWQLVNTILPQISI